MIWWICFLLVCQNCNICVALNFVGNNRLEKFLHLFVKSTGLVAQNQYSIFVDLTWFDLQLRSKLNFIILISNWDFNLILLFVFQNSNRWKRFTSSFQIYPITFAYGLLYPALIGKRSFSSPKCRTRQSCEIKSFSLLLMLCADNFPFLSFCWFPQNRTHTHTHTQTSRHQMTPSRSLMSKNESDRHNRQTFAR